MATKKCSRKGAHTKPPNRLRTTCKSSFTEAVTLVEKQRPTTAGLGPRWIYRRARTNNQSCHISPQSRPSPRNPRLEMITGCHGGVGVAECGASGRDVSAGY